MQHFRNKNGKLDLDIKSIQRILIKNMLHVHIASIDKRLESCERCPIICENPGGYEAEDKLKLGEELTERNRMRNYPNLPSGLKLPYYQGLKNRTDDVDRVKEVAQQDNTLNNLRERLLESRLRNLERRGGSADDAETGAELDTLRCEVGHYQELLKERDRQSVEERASAAEFTEARQRDVASLKQHLRNAEERLKSGDEAQKNVVRILNENIRKLEAEGQAKTRDLSDLEKRRREDVQKEVKEREAAIADLRKQIETAKGAAKKRLQDEIDKHQAEMIERKLSRERAVEAGEKTIADLRKDVENAKGAAKKRLQEQLDKHVAEMSERKLSRERGESATRHTIEDLEKASGKAKGEAKERIDSLLAELKAERDKVAGRDKLNQLMADKVQKAKGELETLQAKLKDAQGDAKQSVQKELDEKAALIEKLTEDLKKVDEEAQEFAEGQAEHEDELAALGAERDLALQGAESRHRRAMEARTLSRDAERDTRAASRTREVSTISAISAAALQRATAAEERLGALEAQSKTAMDGLLQEGTARAASRDAERAALSTEVETEEGKRRDAERARDLISRQAESRRLSRGRERAAANTELDRLRAESVRLQAEVDRLRQRPRPAAVVQGTGAQPNLLEGIVVADAEIRDVSASAADEETESELEEDDDGPPAPMPEPESSSSAAPRPAPMPQPEPPVDIAPVPSRSPPPDQYPPPGAAPPPAPRPMSPPAPRPMSPPPPRRPRIRVPARPRPISPPPPRPMSPPPRRRRRHSPERARSQSDVESTDDDTDDNVPLNVPGTQIRNLVKGLYTTNSDRAHYKIFRDIERIGGTAARDKARRDLIRHGLAEVLQRNSMDWVNAARSNQERRRRLLEHVNAKAQVDKHKGEFDLFPFAPPAERDREGERERRRRSGSAAGRRKKGDKPIDNARKKHPIRVEDTAEREVVADEARWMLQGRPPNSESTYGDRDFVRRRQWKNRENLPVGLLKCCSYRGDLPYANRRDMQCARDRIKRLGLSGQLDKSIKVADDKYPKEQWGIDLEKQKVWDPFNAVFSADMLEWPQEKMESFVKMLRTRGTTINHRPSKQGR